MQFLPGAIEVVEVRGLRDEPKAYVMAKPVDGFAVSLHCPLMPRMLRLAYGIGKIAHRLKMRQLSVWRRIGIFPGLAQHQTKARLESTRWQANGHNIARDIRVNMDRVAVKILFIFREAVMKRLGDAQCSICSRQEVRAVFLE